MRWRGVNREFKAILRMKVCIVSTYPDQGSKNIGDQLITDRTKDFIRYTFGDRDVDFVSVWRADKWENVRDKVDSADLIVFACLAIRKNMTKVEYPYIWEVVNRNKAICVLAAGTQVPHYEKNLDVISYYSEDTISLLRELDNKSILFTTRGVLTRWVCKQIGMKKANFTGDVAFFDSRFFGRKIGFTNRGDIKRVAISDPHVGMRYWPTIEKLSATLKDLFPSVQIVYHFHGANAELKEKIRNEGGECIDIYLDKKNGLDEYSKIDLHVGFRVHGHVSSLVRRKPSYLLVQDGRGCDYELTYSEAITSDCYAEVNKFDWLWNSMLKRLSLTSASAQAGGYSATKICAKIDMDCESGFARFGRVSEQIDEFVENYKKLSIFLKNAVK